MLTKILTILILSIGLWLSVYNNAIFTAAKILPYRDSFDVVQSEGFDRAGILLAISDAEQARISHGTNLTKVADSMRENFDVRYGYDWHCFGSIGQIRSSFWSLNVYIYLKSDTADNMYILCLQSTNSGNHRVRT